MRHLIFFFLLISSVVYSQKISIEIKVPELSIIDSIQLSKEIFNSNKIIFSEKEIKKNAFQFKAGNPGFYLLKINTTNINVYLKPNQSYSLTIKELKDGPLEVKFGDSINDYLQKQNDLTQNYRYNGKSLIRCDGETEFPIALQDLLQKHEDLLQKLCDSISVSSLDKKLLRSRFVNYSNWQKLIKTLSYYSDKTEKVPDYFQISAELLDIKSKNLSYGNNMFIPMLRMYTTYLATSSFVNKFNKKELETTPQKLIIAEYQKNGINTINTLSLDTEIKDLMLFYFMESQIRAIHYSDDTTYLSEKYIKNAEYLAILRDKLRLLIYSSIPDLSLEKDDGTTIKLSELKGKVIYVDFWATWCAPCIKEFSHSINLRKKFKDREDLVFIYASQDSDKDKWRMFLKNHPDLQGLHVVLKEEQLQKLSNSINLKSIPHYLIIDKAGKIAMNFAPRPSDNKTSIILQKVLDNKPIN
ncbi:TlpA disulfide reductase family protein [Emticicia sp. 21SJ11W-3]|uniref:TlpA family protein disulfide reductase n=1 Tax=Emticicia sp. 21SJ11W-3 TaxID=2916755 RepID=UPI00209EF286|nr:TlpA disulfide reductase family protein [Emticicia sp. 21SJ11W-3]UTA67913.1 TlpA family protein disulfide reductase [Emticicia sp. 21SJ11W-3]